MPSFSIVPSSGTPRRSCAARSGGSSGEEPVERHGDEPLVLAVEKLLVQRAQVPEGEDSLPLALDEQVELRRDVAQRVPLDGAPGHEGAEGERDGEREEGDEHDGCEEPRPQRREP